MVEPSKVADRCLFDVPAYSLSEEREEQRRTITERCEAAARRPWPTPIVGWRGAT